MSDLTVAELKSLLQQQCPGLLMELVPGLKRSGQGYEARNPTRADRKPGSFKVGKDGRFCDFAGTSADKGDLLGLIAYVNGHEPKSREGRKFAIDFAKNRLGISTSTPVAAAGLKLRAARQRVEAAEAEARRERFIQEKVWDLCRRRVNLTPGDPGWSYLLGRGIDLAAIPTFNPRALGFVSAQKGWAAYEHFHGPMIIAPVLGARGAVLGLHATLLEEKKTGWANFKPAGKSARLFLGPVGGGIVPLTFGASMRPASDAATPPGPVVLGEGNETCLAIAMAAPEARVWACLSLGNIGRAPVDAPGVSSIIVALENDVSPRAVAARDNALAALEACGKPVSTMVPAVGAGDFDDELMDG